MYFGLWSSDKNMPLPNWQSGGIISKVSANLTACQGFKVQPKTAPELCNCSAQDSIFRHESTVVAQLERTPSSPGFILASYFSHSHVAAGGGVGGGSTLGWSVGIVVEAGGASGGQLCAAMDRASGGRERHGGSNSHQEVAGEAVCSGGPAVDPRFGPGIFGGTRRERGRRVGVKPRAVRQRGITPLRGRGGFATFHPRRIRGRGRACVR